MIRCPVPPAPADGEQRFERWVDAQLEAGQDRRAAAQRLRPTWEAWQARGRIDGPGRARRKRIFRFRPPLPWIRKETGEIMVPHLTTALNGPLLELEKRFLDAASDIERWLRSQWQEHTPPFYGSVDLRNAGFKLVLIDMNLFSGGDRKSVV